MSKHPPSLFNKQSINPPPCLSIGDCFLSKTNFLIVVFDRRYNGEEWFYLIQDAGFQSSAQWVTIEQWNDLEKISRPNFFKTYHETFDEQLTNNKKF